MQESPHSNAPDDDENLPSIFSPAMLMTLTTVQIEGGLAVLAILIAYFAEIPLLAMLIFEPKAFLFGFLGIVPAVLFCWLVYKLPTKAVVFTRQFMRSIYFDFVRHCSVLQLLLVAIMSGIGEELFFRGVLQTTIAQWCGGGTHGLVWGILITSALFGLVHPINKLYVALCFIIGVYLGLIFAVSGNNLTAPIILHAGYNFVVFLAMPQLIGFSTNGNNNTNTEKHEP